MNDELWQRVFRDQEQTHERIQGLEGEMTQAREHLEEVEVFKKLLTVYDEGSPDSTEQSVWRTPEAVLPADAPEDDRSNREELLALKDSIFGWDARSA